MLMSRQPRTYPASLVRRQNSIGLVSWLGGGSLVVVFVVVAAMAFACSVLLGQLVEQQALTRARLAVTSARDLLRGIGEESLNNARVLSERPTLQRFLTSGEYAGLDFFLRRFCESSRADVCAVRSGSLIIKQSGPAVPWPQILSAIDEQGERFLVAPRDGSSPIWGGSAKVLLPDQGPGEIQALVLRLATPRMLAELAPQVGASLSLVNFATYTAPLRDPVTELHSAALTDGRSAVRHFKAQGYYGASQVISSVNGEVIALLDAQLSATEFAGAVRSFNHVLALAAFIVAAIAGLAGVWYGRWLARPVIALRDVAARIGRGDFAAAIPSGAPTEVGALASSMDEMRRNLIALTDSLRQREAEARAVLAGIVEGVFAVDEERRIRYVNPQGARLLMRPESQLLGKFCGDVLNPEPVNGGRPCELSCPILLARIEGSARAAETLRLPNGTTRSTMIVSAGLVAGQQVQVIRDETELESARRARDSVLGNISHEFRTPLAAQLASIELLRDGLASLDPSRQGELLDNVERGVLRLMRLIDNLLESVRIEAGQLAIRHQPVDVREVVQEAIDLIQPILAQRALTLDVVVPHSARPVHGDAQRLVQVFVNLLSNAAKFSPEASTIRIGGVAGDAALELWVEDEGPGPPAGDPGAIFGRFQRGANVEPAAPGLGLGLWIVRSIIERHRGEVRVERTAARRTRFTVSLPFESAT
jgi:signal transduction histidine kinase/HAMP domain-containing protein